VGSATGQVPGDWGDEDLSLRGEGSIQTTVVSASAHLSGNILVEMKFRRQPAFPNPTSQVMHKAMCLQGGSEQFPNPLVVRSTPRLPFGKRSFQRDQGSF
jgi:hypothetical protein